MRARTVVYRLLFASLVFWSAAASGASAAGAAHEPPPPITNPVIGPETRVSWSTSPEADRYLPQVAYNSTQDEYLVVWHNTWPDGHHDIYAQRVSGSGRLLTGFAVSAGVESRLQPDVAYNWATNEYLVVWMKDIHKDGSVYEIWGRLVAWNGAYQKPEFQIASWPNRTFRTPRVAQGDLDKYLVVWNAFDATTGQPTDISSMLLGPGGQKLQGRNLTTSTWPHQVDVVYNVGNDDFLVVFVRVYSQQATGNDIYGLRVNKDNAVINPPGVFEIQKGEKNQNAPRVATNNSNVFLVVWEHEHTATDSDIYGQLLKWDGSKIGQRVPLSTSTADETRPVTAGDYLPFPSEPKYRFLVAWQKEEPGQAAVVGRTWPSHSGPFYEFASYAFWEAAAPAVAWGSPSVLVAYEGDAPGDPTEHRHIYGRRWTPFGVYLPGVLRTAK